MAGSTGSAAAIRLKAMNLMARREHSRYELETKLHPVFASDSEAVNAVLNQLESDGLLCNQRFAECYISSSIRKGRGPQRIRRELVDKGISVALADELLGSYEVDWFALAETVFAKKFGTAITEDVTAKEAQRNKARQTRFLQYRGFGFEHIRHCLESDRAAPQCWKSLQQ